MGATLGERLGLRPFAGDPFGDFLAIRATVCTPPRPAGARVRALRASLVEGSAGGAPGVCRGHNGACCCFTAQR
jgi:hypothetical protein